MKWFAFLFLLLILPCVSTCAQEARFQIGQRAQLGLPPAATLSVTKTADTNDGVCNSDCSLREAVAAAVSGDTITFASPLFDTAQTVQVNGQVVIDKSLTINGRGASLTTIQNIAPQSATSRIFLVDVTGNLTLSNVTVTGGNTSGGIAGFGAGIHNRNLLTVIGCLISGNNGVAGGSAGGGIYSEATVTLINSTLTGNSATQGGGFYAEHGSSTSVNTTVSGNVAVTGGGMYFNSGVATIRNSTLTANSSTSSLSLPAGITIFNNPSVNLGNTILAGNSTPTGFRDYLGTLNSLGSNIIGNANSVTINGDTTGNVLNVNPNLAPLGFYGGATMTHALLTGSPAINAGNNCVTNQTCASNNPPIPLTTDQRGAARVGNVDIGAFESNGSANGGTFRAALPGGIVNSPYNFTLVPSNGTTTHAVTGGALPPGMNLTTALAPNAVVSLTGTPTSGGAFNFSVTATNGAYTSVTDYSINIVVPTAAGVSVSGRVLTSDGRGLRNATVTMTDSNGATRTARSSSFGYFTFEDVEAGQTYVVTVNSKRYVFAPQVVFVADEISGLEFIPSAD